MAALPLDPLHFAVAFGPLAVYLLLLGALNLSPRPVLTTGGRDTAALGIAIVGFVLVGPFELFLPERTAVHFGPYVWLLLLVLYALCLVLVVLMMRPRLIIYNITAEQLRPVLSEVAKELDPEARWSGESLLLPELGVQLSVEPQTSVKLVQLAAVGSQLNMSGWRQLERRLAAALKSQRTGYNPYGATLLSFGLLFAGASVWLLMSDPARVQRAYEEIISR